MKAFLAILPLFALAAADQSSHQAIKLGNAPTVSTSVHKPHGGYGAIVSSQPSAQPSEVKQYVNEEKYQAANLAPSHIPVHAPAYRPAPAPYRPAPYVPAPTYAPRPVYKPAPVAYKPAPTYAPRPVYKPAPAPAYKPRPTYAEPSPVAPPVYNYQYAVQDDYSGVNLAQTENRDNYATNGEYSVLLPDGRRQIVTYNVADAYSGYIADVKYEGVAQPYVAPKVAPAYAPAPVHG